MQKVVSAPAIAENYSEAFTLQLRIAGDQIKVTIAIDISGDDDDGFTRLQGLLRRTYEPGRCDQQAREQTHA